MLFKEAYEIALKDEGFRTFDERVKRCENTGCMIFSIGDEAFSYGCDGTGIMKVKHNPDRSAYLINMDRTYIIEEEVY